MKLCSRRWFFHILSFLSLVIILSLLWNQGGIPYLPKSSTSVLFVEKLIFEDIQVCRSSFKTDWCNFDFENEGTLPDPTKPMTQLFLKASDIISRCKNLNRNGFKVGSERKVCSVKNIQNTMYDYLIVGVDLNALILSNILANVFGKRVLVIDKEDIVGMSNEDLEDATFLSQIGLSSLHSSSESLVKYINDLTALRPYSRKEMIHSDNKYVPFPFNIFSVNQLYQESMVQTVEDMIRLDGGKALNEMDSLMKSLIRKTWGHQDAFLGQGKFKIRRNWDSRYNGEVKEYLVERNRGQSDLRSLLIQHPNIEVLLNVDDITKRKILRNFKKKSKHIFVTLRKLDWFYGYSEGDFERRSFGLARISVKNLMYFQPAVSVSYPSPDVGFLRIVEPKHVLKLISLENGVERNSTDIYLQFYSNSSSTDFVSFVSPTLENRRKVERYKRKMVVEQNIRLIPQGVLSSDEGRRISTIDSVMELLEEMSEIESLDFLHSNGIIVHETKLPTASVVITFCKTIDRYDQEMFGWIPTFHLLYSKYFSLTYYFYSKCGNGEFLKKWLDENVPPDFNMVLEENFPNFGREGHTHLHFILFNNSRIGDFNFFLQDDFHSRECYFGLADILGGYADQIKKTEEEDKNFFTKRDLRDDLTHYNQADRVVYQTVYSRMMFPEFNYDFSCDYYNVKMTRTNAKKFMYVPRGEFFVSKYLLEQVQSRHSTTLFKMYKLLSENRDPIVAGYLMETQWFGVFTGSTINPDSIRLSQIQNVCKCAVWKQIELDSSSALPRKYWPVMCKELSIWKNTTKWPVQFAAKWYPNFYNTSMS